jgi:anti-sigma factor RsiW
MVPVADLREKGQTTSWLEAELARELCPVAAPDSLWRGIHEQRRPLRVRPHRWTAWSIAAASLLMLLAGLVWRLGAARDPAAELEALAAQELRDATNGSGKVDIRSDDRSEIQRWMRARLNIDVRLAVSPLAGNEAVRLIGARLIRFGKYSVGVVTYRVGPDFAELLVADKHAGSTGAAGPGHSDLRIGSGRISSDGDMQLYSWRHEGNDYAIAFGSPKQARQPCLLCHAGTSALMVLR